MKALREFRKHITGIFSNHTFLAIFLVAFLVRVVCVLASHQYLNVDRYELERTALSLAETGVYGNPYSLPTGPSAHVAPGYTLILAAIFKLFGVGVFGEVIKQIFSSAVSAFQCALILPVARAMRLSAPVGLLTATFKALLPVKFGTETMGDWEAPYTAIALMVLSILMVRLYKEKKFNTGRAVLAGALWGLGVLFASALLPILATSILVGIPFASNGGRLRYLRFCAIEILLVAACLAPWAIRNYCALGAPVVTRTNLGLELRISNNDLASADEHVNYANGLYQKYHPLQNPGEARALRQMGELAYNQHAEQQAVAWIRTHPVRFFQLTIQRARLFWFYMPPRNVEWLQRIKYSVLTVMHLIGLLGLVYLLRHNQVAAMVLSMILLVYPIPNYLIHVGPRQSYPVDWILDLLMFSLMVPLVRIVLCRLRGRRPIGQLTSSASPESEAITFSDASQKP